MKAEFVEPFVQSTFHVLSMVAGLETERGALALRKGKTFTAQQLNVVIGVNGDIEGVAVYGMALTTAQKIAGAMLGQPATAFDEMAASAIGEMANMISGGAMTSLSAVGYNCQITPPSMIRGVGTEITTITPSLVVPVRTQFGKMEISLALVEKSS